MTKPLTATEIRASIECANLKMLPAKTAFDKRISRVLARVTIKVCDNMGILPSSIVCGPIVKLTTSD